MSTLKIALPTDDGQRISAHFGRAQAFQVVTLSDAAEMLVEMRQTAVNGRHPQHQHGQEHPHTHAHEDKFSLIADCQVLIAGGMGQPAYDRLQAMGLAVILTGEKQIEQAVALYQAGALSSDLRRIHAHHHHDQEHRHDHDHHHDHHHDHDHDDRPNVTFFTE